MCNCLGKCGCNITRITKGEKGDNGLNGADGADLFLDFITLVDQAVTSAAPYNFNYTAPTSGNYILQLDLTLDIGFDGQFTTRAIKNNVVQLAIPTFIHREDVTDKTPSITYNHNYKITGVVAGDTIGFKLEFNATGITVRNGSITILK